MKTKLLASDGRVIFAFTPETEAEGFVLELLAEADEPLCNVSYDLSGGKLKESHWGTLGRLKFVTDASVDLSSGERSPEMAAFIQRDRAEPDGGLGVVARFRVHGVSREEIGNVALHGKLTFTEGQHCMALGEDHFIGLAEQGILYRIEKAERDNDGETTIVVESSEYLDRFLPDNDVLDIMHMPEMDVFTKPIGTLLVTDAHKSVAGTEKTKEGWILFYGDIEPNAHMVFSVRKNLPPVGLMSLQVLQRPVDDPLRMWVVRLCFPHDSPAKFMRTGGRYDIYHTPTSHRLATKKE